MDVKVCKYCGKEMKIGFAKQSKFCCVECRRAYYKKKPVENAYCEVCGKPLTGTQTKYCSYECRKKATGKKQCENKDRHKKPPMVERKKAKKPSLSLEELAALSKAEGLSAGQYCIKHRLYER